MHKSGNECKGKSPNTCYSQCWLDESNLYEQQRFIVSKVAAGWHELIEPWCIMRPSILNALTGY